MKTLKPFLLSLVFIFACTTLYSQDEHRVTLKCNVAALQAGNPAYQVCQFTDQEPGTDTREYTIYAEVGDTIIWDGESSDGTAAIDIKKIKYNKGTNVFNSRDLDGETTVVGTINNTTNDKPYKYKISFKIDNTGTMYSIDPKIIVGGGQ
jgi:hypothetical protein